MFPNFFFNSAVFTSKQQKTVSVLTMEMNNFELNVYKVIHQAGAH